MRKVHSGLILFLIVGSASLMVAQDPAGRGPRDRTQLTQAIRKVITDQLKSLDLPDSQLTRVVDLTFRYRDSTNLLFEKERFIRSQLNREAFSDGRGDRSDSTEPNQQRIGCLLSEFFLVQRARLDARVAEQRELEFLSPLNRARLMALQERVGEAIERGLENTDQRGGRGGGGRAGPPGGRAGPPGGGGGRAGRGSGGRGGGRGPAAFDICPG